MIGSDRVDAHGLGERQLDLLIDVTVQQTESSGEIVAGTERDDTEHGRGFCDGVDCEVDHPVAPDRDEPGGTFGDRSLRRRTCVGRCPRLHDRNLHITSRERTDDLVQLRLPATSGRVAEHVNRGHRRTVGRPAGAAAVRSNRTTHSRRVDDQRPTAAPGSHPDDRSACEHFGLMQYFDVLIGRRCRISKTTFGTRY